MAPGGGGAGVPGVPDTRSSKIHITTPYHHFGGCPPPPLFFLKQGRRTPGGSFESQGSCAVSLTLRMPSEAFLVAKNHPFFGEWFLASRRPQETFWVWGDSLSSPWNASGSGGRCGGSTSRWGALLKVCPSVPTPQERHCILLWCRCPLHFQADCL